MPDKKYKVFLIEDDKYISRAYQDGLTKEGFDVTPLFDGEGAVDKMSADRPDVILLDLVMPSKNGFEVLEELKLKEDMKDIPVIILSNLGQDSDVEKGKSLGAVGYLIKSDTSLKDVVSKVKEALVKSG